MQQLDMPHIKDSHRHWINNMLLIGIGLGILYYAFSESIVPTPVAPPVAPPVTPPVTAPAKKVPPVILVKKEPAEPPKKKPCTAMDLAFKKDFSDDESVMSEEEEEDVRPRKQPKSKKIAGERNPNLLKAVSNRWEEMRPGLRVMNVLGDGKCWFRAVWIGMQIIENHGIESITYQKKDETAGADQLRQDIVAYIRSNEEHFAPILTQDEDTPKMTMEEYCTNMEVPTTEADGTVMEAFCIMKNVTIIFYMHVDGTTKVISSHGESAAGGTIKLHWSGNPKNHYMLVSDN
jgi:hypothetical protein